MAITRSQQARQMLKEAGFVVQDGFKNYIKNSKSVTVPKEFKSRDIDAYFLNASSLFSYSTNLVPFIPHTSGNRLSMGSRMTGQAVSLTEPEAPLIQTKYSKNQSFDTLIGNYLNPSTGADNAGEVTSVTDDYITIKRDSDGKNAKIGLYNNFPLNQDGFLHSVPIVKKGDKVKNNQVLAKNNFNDQDALALGRNVNTAYMVWNGLNFEDSAVVTESFAKDFTSEKIAKKTIRINKKRNVRKKRIMY